MKRILIENIDDAAVRTNGKEVYSNPSSTVHLLTKEIASI